MRPANPAPRLVIAGLAGDSGKTLLSLAVALQARQAGRAVQAFKKGPDYIDSAWLTWATGRPARNLDTLLMGPERAGASFARHALPAGINLVEGNRGLYDGADARGTHSTAELAKLLRAPVVLILNTTKVTRTAAACVLGCQRLDPDVRIAGVVLNKVRNSRHERVVGEAIESACGIPVLGVLPRAREDLLLPERHLGLVPPEEHPRTAALKANLLTLVKGRLDFQRLEELAASAPPVEASRVEIPAAVNGKGLRIGVLRDAAFTFYYPENLEALEASGARMVEISALGCAVLPDALDALYIGGGFPETHAARLAANRSFLESLRQAAGRGLPVYAECGGLMLLSREIRWQGNSYPMAGVLPFAVDVCPTPQGHGYSRLLVDRPNSFYPVGTALFGHEFHYSRVLEADESVCTTCAVQRGTGCLPGRDGIVAGNVWASYTHLHALASPDWVKAVMRAARNYAGTKEM